MWARFGQLLKDTGKAIATGAKSALSTWQAKALLVLLVVIGVLVWKLRAAEKAEAEATMALEASKIAAAGELAAARVTAGEMKKKLDAAAVESKAFADALAQAQATLKKLKINAKPAEIVYIETKPGKVEGQAGECVLHAEDLGFSKVFDVRLQSDAGTMVAVGAVEGWRSASGSNPERKLFEGSFVSAVSSYSVDKERIAPTEVLSRKLGFGGFVGVASGNGLAFGGSMAIPLFGPLELVAGGGLTTSGKGQAAANILWR